MKRYLSVLICLFICLSCGSRQNKVERIFEDGIEVVLNHLKPYRLKGEHSTIILHHEFIIDTEKDELVDIGFYQPETFDVDSQGNIYIIQWNSEEDYIYKFDNSGSFQFSFCRKGEGPGELQWGGSLYITPNNEIIAKDPSKNIFHVFDLSGQFIRMVRMKENWNPIPLSTGNFFVFWAKDTLETRNQYVGLCDSELENVKELANFQYPNVMSVKCPVNRDRFIYGSSKDRIYVGKSDNGYQIAVFNLDGDLIRKIKKEYKPVAVPEEYKKAYFELFPKDDPLLKNLYFNKNWPPFWDLFTDDKGKLFVLTPEEGLNPGEYWYDIFNPDGLFISRLSLPNNKKLASFPFPVMVKNSRLFCLMEKESGYKQLVVYRME